MHKEELKKLLSKNHLSEKEANELVERIRKELWPELKDKDTPAHCGVCELVVFCKKLDPKLICPWFIYDDGVGKV
ncbi:MAG: hypothetical protein ABSB18_04600 [Candidatus Omnitrophota bacterium]